MICLVHVKIISKENISHSRIPIIRSLTSIGLHSDKPLSILLLSGVCLPDISFDGEIQSMSEFNSYYPNGIPKPTFMYIHRNRKQETAFECIKYYQNFH